MKAVTSHTAHQRTPHAFLMPPWSTAEHIGSVSSNFVWPESRTVCFGNKEMVDNIEWLCIYCEREISSPHMRSLAGSFGDCALVDSRLVGFWKEREEEQSLIGSFPIAFWKKRQRTLLAIVVTLVINEWSSCNGEEKTAGERGFYTRASRSGNFVAPLRGSRTMSTSYPVFLTASRNLKRIQSCP
jgi:hypothetical protein